MQHRIPCGSLILISANTEFVTPLLNSLTKKACIKTALREGEVLTGSFLLKVLKALFNTHFLYNIKI